MALLFEMLESPFLPGILRVTSGFGNVLYNLQERFPVLLHIYDIQTRECDCVILKDWQFIEIKMES